MCCCVTPPGVRSITLRMLLVRHAVSSWGLGLLFAPRDRPCVACATTFLPHLSRQCEHGHHRSKFAQCCSFVYVLKLHFITFSIPFVCLLNFLCGSLRQPRISFVSNSTRCVEIKPCWKVFRRLLLHKKSLPLTLRG